MSKESLVAKIKEAAFKKEVLHKEACASHIRTYFLTGKHVKEDVRCYVDNCKIDEGKLNLSTESQVTIPFPPCDPFCFCYACDRTFHVKCLQYDLSSFCALSAPFLCHECITDGTNNAATNYYASKQWTGGVQARRSKFFSTSVIKAFPQIMSDQGTDDEFDPEDVKSFEDRGNVSLDPVPYEDYMQQQRETIAIGEQFKRYVNESQAEMDRLKKELEAKDQMIKANAQSTSSQPSTSRASFSRASFSAESTRTASTPKHVNITAESILESIFASSKPGKPETRRRVSFLDPEAEMMAGLNKSLPREDDPSLSLADKLLLCSTKAQLENSFAQRQVSRTMQLDVLRKNLPKISKYRGDARGWVKFKLEVTRQFEMGMYDPDVMKMMTLGALEGAAEASVRNCIDESSFEEVMYILEKNFGNSTEIIDSCANAIKKYVIKGAIMRNDAVHINTLIQTYLKACATAGHSSQNSNMLATHILNQLEPFHKIMFKNHYHLKRPNDKVQMPDLEVLFTFLEDLADQLEIRPDDGETTKEKPKQKNTAQIHVTGASQIQPKAPRTDDDFRFKLLDSKTAKFLGYDMTLVRSMNKQCFCCNASSHFTVECTKFKALSDAQRLDLIHTKRLCKCCLLTDNHRAGECALKIGCGYKTGTNRCGLKHHVLLHDPTRTPQSQSFSNQRGGRKSNTNFNSQRGRYLNREQGQHNNQAGSASMAPQSNEQTAPPIACTSSNNPSQANTIAMPNGEPMKYVVTRRQIQNIFTSSSRTIKMFKHHVYGAQMGTCIYSVGDSAAEISLMREDLREQLEIKGEHVMIELQWKDDTIQSIPAIKVNLELQAFGSDEIIEIKDVFAVDSANFALPARSLDVEKLKRQFPYLKAAEFSSYHDATPALLIGSPHAACIEAIAPVLEGGEGKPVAILTKLGWSVYGGTPEKFPDEPYSIDTTTLPTPTEATDMSDESDQNERLTALFEHYCSIESLGITPKNSHRTEEETMAIDAVEAEWKDLADGSIEVPLAWRKINGKIPKLPDNYGMVIKRQIAQERKLAKNPQHLAAFNANFQELIKEGYVREATEKDIHHPWPNIWYLPMSLVVNENKIPIKYRTVYDASAKYQNVSLNSHLLKGPKLLVDMLQPLFKFRQCKIAFTCDVKSMYHRVRINERDQQVQRILWRENSDQPMKIFIQQVMLFGPTSSPFTSQLVKNKVADRFINHFPESTEALKHHMYMDDGLMSVDTVEKAVEVAMGCIEILKSINWHLVGFQSNSAAFLKKLPRTHVKTELVEILSSELEEYSTKVLGCVWDPQADCFKYAYDNDFVKAVVNHGHIPTKRDQASTVARMFDVRGEVSHYIIRGRILLQRSWRNKIGWDEPISEEENKLWIKWLKDLEAISSLRIPRRYAPHLDSLTEADKIELHVFCDAGKEAFAAAAFFVFEYRGMRTTALVMAKAKVTPLKRKTLTEMSEMPRLELTSCLIAARMSQTILEYHPELKPTLHLWTDSSIALTWIKNPNHQLEKFAISPVEEILELTDRQAWNHVPSEQNPADIATKFQKFDFSDTESIWFKGPPFLTLPEREWPSSGTQKIDVNKNAELVCSIAIDKTRYRGSKIKLPPINCEYSANFLARLRFTTQSNWIKITRAVGRALKLMDLVSQLEPRNKSGVNEFKDSITKDPSQLEPLDYERAELFIIRRMQLDAYHEDYLKLSKGQLSSHTDFLQLRVFLDEQGILRINSRVALDPEIYPQRFLPLVPRKHFWTEVLLFYYHAKYSHISVDAQLAEVRARYWIPHARREIARIKKICNYCGYMRAHPQPPPMAPLPEDRIDATLKPFEVVGLDCTGEIMVKKHTRQVKVYILLFTCTLTRFVHVHLLEKMDSLAVLEALTVFWDAHGPVRKIITDNGRNFVGAARRLKRDLEDSVKEQLLEKRNLLRQQLAEKWQLEWQFIPPYSPWFGGFYERLIGEVKRAIELTVRKKKLSQTELNIAIHDAAHRINCRPLTNNPLEAEDKPVLTPHLLAKQRDGWPLLPSSDKAEYDQSDLNDRLIFHRGRAVADEITQRFVKERLPLITRQSKWFKDIKDLEVGDLVLLVDPSRTRYQWPRARVVEVHPGRDGRVRVVDVKLPSGDIISRYSAQRVAKLDIVPYEPQTARSRHKSSEVSSIAANSPASANSPAAANSPPQSAPLKEARTACMIRVTTIVKTPRVPAGKQKMKKIKVTGNKVKLQPKGQIWTIQLEPVNNSLPLHEVLLILSRHARSIIGIYRLADYDKFIPQPTVYIQLTDEGETQALVNLERLSFNNTIARIEQWNVVNTTVSHIDEIRRLEPSQRNGAPLSLQVVGFEKDLRPREFVFLLRDLLQEFEHNVEVTGARLTVDLRKLKLRNFGYVNFMVKRQLVHFHETQLPFLGGYLSCHISDNVPLLMRPTDIPLLTADARWNAPIKAANLLTYESLQPTVTVQVDATPATRVMAASGSGVDNEREQTARFVVTRATLATKSTEARRPPKRRMPVEVPEAFAEQVPKMERIERATSPAATADSPTKSSEHSFSTVESEDEPHGGSQVQPEESMLVDDSDSDDIMEIRDLTPEPSEAGGQSYPCRDEASTDESLHGLTSSSEDDDGDVLELDIGGMSLEDANDELNSPAPRVCRD